MWNQGNERKHENGLFNVQAYSKTFWSMKFEKKNSIKFLIFIWEISDRLSAISQTMNVIKAIYIQPVHFPSL